MPSDYALTKQELFETLHSPTYPAAEASRLAGISSWRARAWLKGYSYKYEVGDKVIEAHQDPVVDPDKSKENYASFLDLIDLLFVKRFLENGIPLQQIRKALDEARNILGTNHFARNTFFTSGSNLILQLPIYNDMVALLTGGQTAIPEIIQQLGEKIDFEEVTGYGLASRWYPNGREGLIVIDPRISFGKPTIVNHRITTANIYDLYLGERDIKPVSKWFDLPEVKIQAAIKFETALAV